MERDSKKVKAKASEIEKAWRKERNDVWYAKPNEQ